MTDGLRRSLEDMFCEMVCYELVLTTVGNMGAKNAAPVGVRRSAGNLIVDLAEESLSLSNLRSKPQGVLNVVHDPLVFAEAAFDMLPNEAFSAWSGSEIPLIRSADAVIEVRAISESPVTRTDQLGTSQFLRLVLQPSRLRVRRKPKPLSRRTCAAIEAIIAVTKAEVAGERSLLHLLPEFEQTVSRAQSVAGRTGRDPRTDKVFEICKRRLCLLRAKPGGGRE